MSAILRALLTGQQPSGKNQIGTQIFGGRIHRFPNSKFERWRGQAYAQLDRQRGVWEKLRTKATITVLYYPGDLIGRDVPGMQDALWNVLEWCPVHRKRAQKKDCIERCRLPFVVNDKLLATVHWIEMPLDRERPRQEIEINPYSNTQIYPQGG